MGSKLGWVDANVSCLRLMVLFIVCAIDVIDWFDFYKFEVSQRVKRFGIPNASWYILRRYLSGFFLCSNLSWFTVEGYGNDFFFVMWWWSFNLSHLQRWVWFCFLLFSILNAFQFLRIFIAKFSIHRQVSKTFQIFSIFNLPQNQFDRKAISPWTNFHENPLQKCNYFSIICRTLWGSTKHIFVKRILTAAFKDCSNFLRLEICLSHNRFIYHFSKHLEKD